MCFSQGVTENWKRVRHAQNEYFSNHGFHVWLSCFSKITFQKSIKYSEFQLHSVKKYLVTCNYIFRGWNYIERNLLKEIWNLPSSQSHKFCAMTLDLKYETILLLSITSQWFTFIHALLGKPGFHKHFQTTSLKLNF